MPKIVDMHKRDQVYEHVRDMILNLVIKPGEKIPEQEIAKQLGISRTPVREAVRRLALEGLIKIDPNKSATVIVLDDSFIRELALVRCKHLELTIPLVIFNGSNRDFMYLNSIAENCLDANRKGQLNERHYWDMEFHDTMIQMSKNRVLYNLAPQLSLLVRLWQAVNITSPSMQEQGLHQHLEIVKYLEQRKVKPALELARKHTLDSYRTQFEQGEERYLLDIIDV